MQRAATRASSVEVKWSKREEKSEGEFCPVLRCTQYQTFHSLWTDRFLHFTDLNVRKNRKLSVCEIMELVYLFIMDVPLKVATNLMERSGSTVTDWYFFCCEVYDGVVAKKEKNERNGY